MSPTFRPSALALALTALGTALLLAPPASAGDRLAEIQARAVKTPDQKIARPYHFGSQGPNDVFTNHTSHSNRLIPVYTFGTKVDLGAVTGSNSRYRDEARIKELFNGKLPANTLNPEAEYADQSDLYAVQKAAVDRGVKHLFIVWFDGMDYDTTRAAAIHKSGKVYNEGKGSGLIFQDYAKGNPQYGYVVTTPTYDKNVPDVDAQTLTIPPTSLLGGYDAEIAGPNPWTPGRYYEKARGYLKGQNANKADAAGVASVGRVLHAYTDSSTSAAEFASGKKAYNNGVNVLDDGSLASTLFQQIQQQGWKVGTVTSVPFDHASPSAMYAHNVHRDDYQDLARDMLGLPSIMQKLGKEPAHPGLDVVMGTGFGRVYTPDNAKRAHGKGIAGENLEEGNTYLAPSDLEKIDVANGGKYVVAHTKPGVEGAATLKAAADKAAADGHRLFGFFGSQKVDHLPFRTANGDYKPVGGKGGSAESYTPAELKENPTLAQMTDAALTVITKSKQPFALFVESGDVDYGLHNNNLDNAVGAVYSGEAAIARIIDWVETNSNWDDSAMIVTSDHGHYLVIDDPNALIEKP